MEKRDTERLLLSTGLALVFMAAVFLLLSLFDFMDIELPEYSGPLYVSLGDAEPVTAEETETAEQPQARPQAEEAEPETARAEDPAEAAEGPAAAAAERTAPSEEQPRDRAAEAVSGRDPAAEPVPEREAPAGPGTFERTGPEGEMERIVERPDAVQPEELTPRGDTETGTAGTGDTGAAEDEEPAAESGGLYSDLSSLDRALAESEGDEGTETAAGTAAGDGTGAAGRSIGTPDNPVTLDELAAVRRPISLQDPVIDPSLARNLPPKWNIEVSFTLEPSGHITDLQIRPDSGNTEIDSIVREAIRKWRFQAVSESAGSVRVRVLYTITVR